mgnify:CR=1 FL=1
MKKNCKSVSSQKTCLGLMRAIGISWVDQRCSLLAQFLCLEIFGGSADWVTFEQYEIELSLDYLF